jgi:hypothetical protein
MTEWLVGNPAWFNMDGTVVVDDGPPILRDTMYATKPLRVDHAKSDPVKLRGQTSAAIFIDDLWPELSSAGRPWYPGYLDVLRSEEDVAADVDAVMMVRRPEYLAALASLSPLEF